MSKLETNTIDTVSGTANLTIGGANNTGTTTIKTNDTTAMTIDSSQNVGIGTTSPVSLGSNITTLEITGGSTIRTGAVYLSSSDKNIKGYFYGSNTGFNIGSETNADFKFVTNNTERMNIDSSGRVIIPIAGSNPSVLGALSLKVDGGSFVGISMQKSDTDNLGAMRYYNSSGTEVGSIVATESATSFNTSSDYRLKENIVEITDATSRLKQLQPKRFNFIADADTTVDGFLAHEVSSVVPEAISGEKDAVQIWKEGEELPEGVSVGDNKLDENGNTIPVYQGIDQAKLVPLLVKTIQELEARITELENA